MCPAGTFSEEEGATSASTCSACPAGTFSAEEGATSASTCSACPAGKFAAVEAATNCSACDAPPGNACSVGSVSTEGTACPGHLVCPGGALGGNPVLGIVVGVYAAASLVGACYIAYEMLFQPERCGGCGESTDCSRPSLRVVKKRLVAALPAFASWLLLAVLAAHAVPWVLPALGGGMIAVAVLASLLSAVAVPALYFFAWPKWINQPFCCLCQQGGNPRKVHIDIEANSCVCGGCKTRYQGMHRAPGGALAYDASASSLLIVGVPIRLELASGLIPGLPSTSFRADSLPPGVSINVRTGAIEGVAASAARCQIKVTAFNDSGECSTTLNLCVRGQTTPSSITYSLPAVSEFSCPPNRTGLLFVGDFVLMKSSCAQAGLPAGTFSVQPALPAGLTLNAQTGDIQGTSSTARERKDYTVTLANPSGKTVCTISLEVQKHTPPGVLEYPSELGVSVKLHKIFPVGDRIAIMPTRADQENHLFFSVSPALPEGLTIDTATGTIAGSPSIAKLHTRSRGAMGGGKRRPRLCLPWRATGRLLTPRSGVGRCAKCGSRTSLN